MIVKKTGIYLKFNGLTLSLGNSKLDKSILIFNIPAVKTCPNNSDCRKRCYAFKFEKLYPSVKICRENNYQKTLSTSFVGDVSQIIQKAIKLGVKAVRVHESGDFYSAIYAQQWETISNKFESLKFFAYTKSPYRPDNFNIVESILPDGSINFGSVEDIDKKHEKYKYPICPATKTGKRIVCGVSCKLCQSLKHVLFYIH